MQLKPFVFLFFNRSFCWQYYSIYIALYTDNELMINAAVLLFPKKDNLFWVIIHMRQVIHCMNEYE
jgi:hypothetical protein